MVAAAGPVLEGLPPVIDGRARVLILGSFPSVASLAAGEYYAHGRNQFWPLLEAVLGSPLVGRPYAERLDSVRAAGLAIWDVYASCTRSGSLDAAIRAGVVNDFGRLGEWAPGLARICFNGAAAGRQRPLLAALGYQVHLLPSSSPAHAAKSIDAKGIEWRQALGFPA